MQFFADAVHDEFGSWALGFAPYGGADVGEVLAVAAGAQSLYDALTPTTA